MEPVFYVVGAMLALFLALLPLILRARVSHWTHATQRRLEETNALLASLLQEQRNATTATAESNRLLRRG